MKTIVRGLVAALLLLPVAACSGDDEPKIEVGKEFTWNDFTVSEGWALETTEQMIEMEMQDQPFITGEITNDGEETRYALFEFVFVGDGDLQATIKCTSELELAPGEASPLSCPGLGQVVPQGYDLIQVGEITR